METPGVRYTDDAGHERFISARAIGDDGWTFEDAPMPGNRPCDDDCPWQV